MATKKTIIQYRVSQLEMKSVLESAIQDLIGDTVVVTKLEQDPLDQSFWLINTQ